MSRDITKKQRAEMRKLHGLAWEREVEKELGNLESSFKSWRNGEIDAFDLSELIHKFHDGKSRDLYNFYTHNNSPFAVPSAIAKGIIAEAEVSKGLLEVIEITIQNIREQYDE